MKELFLVQYNRQVLKSGDWNDENCDWDWEIEDDTFDNFADAKAVFNKAEPTDDCPLIRLYRIFVDKYGNVEYRELLGELC